MNAKGPETWKEAVKMCKATLQKFVPDHDRIELMIHFHVFPPRYDDPVSAKTPEEALKKAEDYNEMEKRLEDLEKGRSVKR